MTQQQNSQPDNIKGAIKDIVDPKKTFINSALGLTKGLFHSDKKIGEMNGRWAALFRICMIVVILGIPSIGGWGLWLTRNAINTEYHLESTVRFEDRIDILEQNNVMLERVAEQIDKISKDVDKTALEITTILTDLQKQITKPAGSGDGSGDATDAIEGSVKALQNQISALKKLRDETSTTVDEYTKFTLQIEKLQDELKELQGIMDRPQVESVSAFIAAEDTKLTKFLETELAKRESSERTNAILAKGEQDRLLAQEKLADMIVQQAGKFGQIQSQAFDAQIKRLDTERDIILNNDNLTSQEKDRLLKENDKQSRKIRIQQIKFERDMHMIEMSMELAKLALQGKTLLAGIIGTGAKQTAEATGSISRFLTDLGPVAGPIAYAAMIGCVIAKIITARRKAEQQIKALSGPLAGVSSGGGGSATVSAPSFNVVGATQTTQVAQSIAGSEDKPLRAYVVASDVSTAQELERSTIEGASIG